MNLKNPSLISFLKAQIVAGIATTCDFIILILFTEVFKIWYLTSAFCGALTGGIIGFLLGKYWAFMPKEKRIIKQAYRYFFVFVCSIILNVIGMYIVVDMLNIQYVVAKVITATTVAVFFNFFMHKYFVFR